MEVGKLNGIAIRRKGRIAGGIRFFLAVFWIVTIILPLMTMFTYMADVDIIGFVTSRRFEKAFWRSISVSTVATVISMFSAGVLAWCTERTTIRFKGMFSILFTIPMLIPSISHGMGLIIAFGANGVIKNILGFEGSIYGFWGIVIGTVMYSFPVAYLMLLDILKFEDSTPYEAARVMGLSAWDKLCAITLPYMRRPLISVFFATFTMVFTDYGVPLMIGGKYTTLPVMMYQDVIGMLDFGKGSVIGAILLIPAFIACVLDIVNKDKADQAYVNKPFVIRKNIIRDGIAYALCCLTLVALLLPIVIFAAMAFIRKYPVDMSVTLEHVHRAFSMNMGDYLINSVVISVFVALIGVIIAITCAYFTARMVSRFSRALHLLSITSLAIPGIVLGLSYVLFFKGTKIYGTFAILILINTMHFFASPYLMIFNTFNKLNANLEAVGKTLGIKRWDIIIHVLLPQAKNTVFEMASYFFVNSMMTISAVSFLASVSNKPMALMITQFEGQMQLECAAFVSLVILVINTLIKGIVYLLRSTGRKK